MERRTSSTRAGVPAWTPAPGYPSSPNSPNGSRPNWDEDRDEDFQSQMDENGIIGLREGIEGMDEEEEEILSEEEDVLMDAGTPEPEKGPPPALDDLSCNLSELLDSEPFSQPTADDCPSPSHNDDDDSLGLEDWSDDEDEQKPHEEHLESAKINRSVRDMVASMTDDGTEGTKQFQEPSFSLQEKVNPKYSQMKEEHEPSNEKNEYWSTSRNPKRTSETPANPHNQHDGTSSHSAGVSSPLSSKNYLDQLSREEPNWNFRPEAAETFPEQASPSSRLSCTPGASPPIFGEGQGEESECVVTPQLQTRVHHRLTLHHPPVPVPRKAKCGPQESRQHPAKPQSSSSDSSPFNSPHHRRHRGQRPSRPSQLDTKDVRKGQLSHPVPDFSKVEPKVRFPKGDYKPPRSRRPRKKDSSPDAPLMYRSPADIVREVLLSSTEGLSDTAAPGDLQRSVDSTAPTEVLCPLQASTMVQQLQDDYNRLLTKYAEAENTIDRLRLEAKVGLQCVSPRSIQSALPGVLNSGSKVMTLSFPQAQRAELSAETACPAQRLNTETSDRIPTHNSSVDSVSPRGHLSLIGAQITESLPIQLQRFQLQVDEFEKLMKSGKRTPVEQMQGLSQLVQGQDSLEKAYLAVRDHHQQIQKQTRGNWSLFDPERELESQIFNLGLRLEELKERIEQSEQNQPKSELGPSPGPQAHQLSASFSETVPQPETPVSAAHTEGTVELEGSLENEGSDGDKEEDAEEDIFPSVLHHLHQKHKLVEKDYSNLMDHYQSFRELSKRLDRGPSETHESLEFRASPPHPAVINEGEDDQRWRTRDEDSVKSADHSSSDTLNVCNSKEALDMGPLPATALPSPHGSERRPSGSSTSHSNLEESAAVKKRASKRSDRVLRATLQDGIGSAETDSGFLGSESSRLTPAVHSPFQQRTAVRLTRPSVTQEPSTVKPETVSVSGQPAVGSRVQIQPSPALRSLGAQDSTRRGGLSGRRYLPSPSTSSSPLRLSSGPLQPWSDSAQSLSGEEARQEDHYILPANQNGQSLRSPSPAVPYRHGDHLKAQSSVQLTNRHEALQSLQKEVDRLQEHLEVSLRTSSPSSPVRARFSVLEDLRSSKPSHTSTPLQPDSRSLGPQAANRRALTERSTEEKEERRTAPKPEPRRRSASLPRFRTELSDMTTDSEHAQFDPKPQPLRHFPVSPTKAPESPRARAEPKPHLGQQHSSSPDLSEEDDDEAEGSRRSDAAVCTRCTVRQSSRTSARVIFILPTPVTDTGRVRNGSPSHTSHFSGSCVLCGASKTKKTRVLSPANQSSIQRSVSSIHRERGSVYLAAALPPTVLGSVHLVQYVPVCPTVFYYSSPVALSSVHPQPHYLSRSYDDRGHKSGVRGHHRRSRSVDTQHSLRHSLDRAMDATRNMHDVSRRMARSLASRLQHTSPPAQSCSY